MSKKEEQSKTAAEMLEGIVGFLRRSTMFWKRSTLIFLLVAAASVPGVFLKPRVYKSETTVLYQETIKSTDLTGGEGSGENARRLGARLKEMLFSRASLEPIVREYPRYAKIADRRGMVDAVDDLRENISFNAREGDTFAIGFSAPDPKEAQDVARRLGERIVAEAAARRKEQGNATTDYLKSQSDQNKAKLRAADGALSGFLTLHPEFIPLTLPGGSTKAVVVTPTTGPAPPPGTKDPVLFQLQSEAANLERQLRAANGAPPGPAPVPVAPPESADVAAARKDLADKRAQFTDQHPDVVAARRRLALAIEADKRAAPPPHTPPPVAAGKLSDAEKDALEQRLTAVRRSIAARRSGAPPPPVVVPSAVPGASATVAIPGSPAVALEVEFRRLQREVEYLKDAQRQLDDKLFKAALTEGASVGDRNSQVSVLDAAYLPAHPSSKPRSSALATYLAAGIILAFLLALVSARLDDRIYQRGDLDVLDILPVIGVIPKAAAGRRRSG